LFCAFFLTHSKNAAWRVFMTNGCQIQRDFFPAAGGAAARPGRRGSSARPGNRKFFRRAFLRHEEGKNGAWWGGRPFCREPAEGFSQLPRVLPPKAFEMTLLRRGRRENSPHFTGFGVPICRVRDAQDPANTRAYAYAGGP